MQLFDIICDKTNILRDIYILKNYVLNKLSNSTVAIAPYVRIKNIDHVCFNNSVHSIKGSKSKLYYLMLSSRCKSRGNMESVYAKQFSFPNHVKIWKNVYQQKVVNLKVPKLCEFNYKILQNILPCGRTLYKWKKIKCDKCEYCGKEESIEHMLYGCERIKLIWKRISDIINVNISWKQIVCGFPNVTNSSKINAINYVLSIVAYIIFKQNSLSKYENIDYKSVHILPRVKHEIKWYACLINTIDKSVAKHVLFKKVTEDL